MLPASPAFPVQQLLEVLHAKYRGCNDVCLRRPAEVAHLDRVGSAIVVYELQGDLSFANVERLTREVIGGLAQTTFVILDARRLSSMDQVAGHLIGWLADAILTEGPEVSIVPPGTPDVPPSSMAAWLNGARSFGDVDAALKHCEDRLLERAGLRNHACTARYTLADTDVFHDLDAAEQAALADYVTYEQFGRGAFMVREGDESDRLFAVLHGRAEIQVRLAGTAEPHRLGTLSAGSVFGEPAMFTAGRRTADVVVLTELNCCVLTTTAMERLRAGHPGLHARLLGLVGRSLTDRLRRANAEIRALAR